MFVVEGRAPSSTTRHMVHPAPAAAMRSAATIPAWYTFTILDLAVG